MKVKVRVRLEPELEAIVSDWTASKRLAMARKLERWSRQLRVSAKIIIVDSTPDRQLSLKFVPPRKQALN